MNNKSSSLSQLTFHMNGTSMHFYKLFRDRQSNTCSLVEYSRSGCILEKTFKNFLSLIFRNTNPCITNLDRHPFFQFVRWIFQHFQHEMYLTPLERELKSV